MNEDDPSSVSSTSGTSVFKEVKNTLILTDVDSNTELNTSESNDDSDIIVDMLADNEEGFDDKTKTMGKIFKSFDDRINELKAFKFQYGHCRVPSKFEANPSMAAWCANLKQSYRLVQEGKKPILKLNQEKINVLEDIGFEWKHHGRLSKENILGTKVFPSSSSTQDNLDRVSSPELSIKKNTSPRIKPISSTKNDLVNGERESVTNNSSTFKDEESSGNETRVQMQESMTNGKIIMSSDSKESTVLTKNQRRKVKSKRFYERIEELKVFKSQNGHCRVSRNCSTNYSLGSWCHSMRVSYRATKKQGINETPILAQEQINALDELGFDWSLKEPRQMKSFDERLEDLKEFKQNFGHTRVPTGYEKNPSLAYWCNNVKNAYKMKNTGKKQYIALNQERIKALEQIGFEFGKRTRSACNENDAISFLNSKKSNKLETVHPIIKKNDETNDPNNIVKELEGGVGPIMLI